MPIAEYRKRETPNIKAVRFDPAGEHRRVLPAGVRGLAAGEWSDWSDPVCRFYTVTIQLQQAPVLPGDWIIEEPDGIHHYPCSDDVFRARYEAVT